MSIFEFTNKELKTKKKIKILLQVKAKNNCINNSYGGSLCRTEKRALFSIFFQKRHFLMFPNVFPKVPKKCRKKCRIATK